MKKFLSNADKRKMLNETEQKIINSFRENFNKIKRLNENALSMGGEQASDEELAAIKMKGDQMAQDPQIQALIQNALESVNEDEEELSYDLVKQKANDPEFVQMVGGFLRKAGLANLVSLGALGIIVPKLLRMLVSGTSFDTDLGGDYLDQETIYLAGIVASVIARSYGKKLKDSGKW